MGDESEALDDRPYSNEEIRRMMSDQDHIIVKAKMIGGSAKAWHLRRLSDGETFWVPKSVSEWQSHETWAIAKWFADKEGIE